MANSPQKKDNALLVRLRSDEKEAFRNAANIAGIPLSAWVRERLRHVARRELQDAGCVVPFLAPLPTSKEGT